MCTENLYELKENCQFGSLIEDLIRDCIVVEISNTLLSQKLMQDDRLTLDKAVKEAWSFELVKEQQKILKADENGKLREKVNRIIVE